MKNFLVPFWAVLLLSLDGCANLRNSPYCPDSVGVSVGVSHGVEQSEVTTFNVAVIPVWRLKAVPVERVRAAGPISGNPSAAGEVPAVSVNRYPALSGSPVPAPSASAAAPAGH